MKQKLAVLLMLALLIALPAVSLAADTIMWVKTQSGNYVNMRAEPTTESEIIAHVPYGYRVINHNDFVGSKFAHCSFDGKSGYISMNFLVNQDPGPYSPKPNPKPNPTARPEAAFDNSLYRGFVSTLYLAKVTPNSASSSVNLRWGPSKETPVHSTYSADQILLVIAENDEWCQVIDQQTNMSGFMMKSLLAYDSDYTE